ncbi:hypothetical protein AAF712_002499 [Marasmius tenuissimus]|uniref:Uncharacterized protein n=1 Tax=Marasmius tenuissimus TaxID=585030 RepID=A0ABR3A9N2_9AGAR
MSESNDQILPEDQQDTMEETNPMEEVDEFKRELVREQEEWDRLGHGISQGRMLTDAQWMATMDEHVGPLGNWLEPWLLKLRPIADMTKSNLWMLLELYVDAELNSVDEIDFGIEQVPETFRSFLPNQPTIIKILQLYPDYVAVFSCLQPGDDLNILKSEVITEIASLNLNPQKPGGSKETALEFIPEDEPNPESLQNTPFASVVLPRHCNAPVPQEIDLRKNLFDVGLMDSITVPWHVNFLPQLDIPQEQWHYYDFNTRAFMSTSFSDHLLERVVEVVSLAYMGVLGERAVIFWDETMWRGWGLIVENSKKNSLFSFAIIKGDDGNAVKEQILCEALTGPNFNEYFKARIRWDLDCRGIFNIEYWTTKYIAEGPFEYVKGTDSDSKEEGGKKKRSRWNRTKKSVQKNAEAGSSTQRTQVRAISFILNASLTFISRLLVLLTLHGTFWALELKMMLGRG